MTIQSGNTVDVVIGSGDTTILNPTDGRALITSATVHEQTGATETLELFISADASSAAAERIDSLSFSAGETQAPLSLIRAVPSGQYLIGNAGTGSQVMVSITYTQYSGSS